MKNGSQKRLQSNFKGAINGIDAASQSSPFFEHPCDKEGTGKLFQK